MSDDEPTCRHGEPELVCHICWDDDAVRAYFAKHGYDLTEGARKIREMIDKAIERRKTLS